MRFATYNVEWFDALFDDTGALRSGDGWSGRYNVTRAQQIAALGRVFQTLDADLVMIIEAPDHSPNRSTVTALESFAAAFSLRARRALIGFSNDTQQEIALLYDPDAVSPRHDPRSTEVAPQFDTVLALDVDVDAAPEAIRFSKPPLEVGLETAKGTALHLIGVHAKSKAPYGATTDAEATRISIANRRKQLAQCIWLRRRVDALLAARESLVIMGDLNDGPGLDEFEKLFGRSGVEIVLGGVGQTPLYDPHAALGLSRALAATPTSARFFNRQTKRWLSVLLDYIMVSPDLAAKQGAWRIWHPFDDPECWADEGLRNALLTASDHFPVTWDVDV